MKVIFMGTPDFAVPALRALHARHQIVAVYCQPPRPAGRGKEVRKSPVQVAQFKEGKQQVLGFLVGQVMKASGGKANPGKVNELLKKKLAKES